MTRVIRPILVILLLCLGTVEARAALQPGDFQPFVEDGRSEMHFADEVLPLFDGMVSTARSETSGFQKLEDGRLLALAADAAAANFYFPGSRAAVQADMFEELERRGTATDLQVSALHHTFVAARMWAEAKALAKRYPAMELEDLPANIDAGTETTGLQVWDFYPATQTLGRREFTPRGPLTLVVISHPNCAFSRAAVRALDSDPSLAQKLPEQRIFVAPTFGGLQLERIGEWNAAHPDSRHVLVDRPLAWSFVKNWETPQFLFLVDGVVVEHVVGWPDEAQLDVLMSAAQRATSKAERAREPAPTSR